METMDTDKLDELLALLRKHKVRSFKSVMPGEDLGLRPPLFQIDFDPRAFDEPRKPVERKPDADPHFDSEEEPEEG